MQLAHDEIAVGMKTWSTGSRVWVTVGSALLLGTLMWLTWWLLAKTQASDGAGIANVLALAPSVLGFVAGVAGVVVGLRSRPDADDPAVLAARARTLLGEVAAAEARTLLQLLWATPATPGPPTWASPSPRRRRCTGGPTAAPGRDR